MFGIVGQLSKGVRRMQISELFHRSFANSIRFTEQLREPFSYSKRVLRCFGLLEQTT